MNKKGLNKNKEGFKVPEDYFENFENHLFDTLEEKPRHIPSDEGFMVPPAYFESFEARLFEKIETSKEPKLIKLNPYRKYFYACVGVAATIILILVIRGFNPKIEKTDFASLGSEEIETYFDTDEFSLSEYDIVQIYDDVDIEEIELFSEAINDDELIEYIYDTTDDYDILMDGN